MRRSLSAFLFALGLVALAPAYAQVGLPPDAAPKVQARFVAEHTEVAPGGTVTIALHEVIREGWHTYWRNPGDSGAPTFINWTLPAGWSVSEISWPYPTRLPIGPLMNYGYENEVALLFDITAPADAVPGETINLPADVGWLVCADVCIPEDTSLELPLTVSAAPAPPTEESHAFFDAARGKLPLEAGFAAVYEANATRFSLRFEEPAFVAAPPRDAVFFPYADGIVEPAVAQTMRAISNGLVLETEAGWEIADPEKRPGFGDISGVLVLTSAGGPVEAFAVEASPGVVPALPVLAAESSMGLWAALAFALLGGIILNLMPCVLPVLSMKALALAGAAGIPGEARREALAYAGGVVVTFLLLALALLVLRAGGAAAGWGFQLQQPIFVAALALLMFAVGLSLAGVFQVGAGSFAGMGQSLAGKGGATGSFFTGMLAVVVATPCTAPFMAAALGYAATQSAVVSLSVFLALAAGFALPFLALGFSPSVLKHIPRPGPWMDVFKQVLAFPMFGAALWLVWVLTQQTGPDGLFALLAAALTLAFALWAYGASRNAGRKGGVIGLTSAALGLVLTVLLVLRVGESVATETSAPGGSLGYENYTSQRLAELRAAGTPVFVNATAAWCITCLVNEQVALSGETLKKRFEQESVVAVKADWTNQNPEITALLSEYGRNGVPLYLYFAPGADRAEVLPQLLTEAIVLAALDAD